MGGWVLPKVPGVSPGPRGGHACVSVGAQVIVFGGSDRTPVTFDDLWVLDTRDGPDGLQWTRVAPTFADGCKVHPRSGATLTAIGAVVYLFGGQEPVTEFRFADLKALDVTTWTWSDVTVAGGVLPPARHSHTACCLADQCLLVYGGSGYSGSLADVWVFNTQQGGWQQPTLQGAAPPGREMHTATMTGPTRMLVYGGRGSDGSVLSDAALLDVADMRWAVVEPTPFPRCAHCCAALPLTRSVSEPSEALQASSVPSTDEQPPPQEADSSSHPEIAAENQRGQQLPATLPPDSPASRLCMIVHGGFSGEAVEGDVLCIDGETLEVEVLHRGPRKSDTAGSVPPVRFGAAAAQLTTWANVPVMVVFGGVNPEEDLADLCIWAC